ncbi:GGDEF domain-containing protein [Paraburkholderia sp. DHOC27]|uniref:GGDEF domain-containing protein n=1 Tax=Paraburkholderia sp. DHOC27 TaxID=2303330 RepID=UPI000E3D8A3B|nr:GGDEF domain-containing protein [Paraburkholderia sp. DHOC27]RFU44915.1 GGDEF domain-containing protein [Paraburkholderia sp. DHOC27]
MFSPVSILVVTVLSGLMATAVLGSLLPAAIPGLGCWIAANTLAVVSLLLFATQGHVSPLVSIVGANELLAVSVMLVLEGCNRFLGRARRPLEAYAGAAVVLVSIVYWTFYEPDFDARVTVVSAFHAYLYASIAWAVLRGRPAGRPSYSYNFVSVAALLFSLGHAARGLVYGLGNPQQTDLLQVTPLNTAFMGIGILALPCMSTGIVMLAHDRLAQRLERLANVDDLTGVWARRAFLTKAQAVLDAAARNGMPVALAIIDIDRFKLINDSYGHAAGDSVLTHFAAFVQRQLRAGDVFGRLGGEEFGVLCPDTDAAQAAILLERLRAELASTPPPAQAGVAGRTADHTAGYTFSSGVDQLRNDEPLAALMARADAALYAAKAMGRDRVVVAA